MIDLGREFSGHMIVVNDENDAWKAAVWLQSALPTRQRLACWTADGLAFAGVTPAHAALLGLEGWPHE